MSNVKQFIKNVAVQFIGYGIGALCTIIITPYILKHVDVAIYGIYMLILSIVPYFSLVEFGMGSALVKYVAELFGVKDWGNLQKYINVSLLFYTCCALLAGISIVVFSFFYEHFFIIRKEFIFVGRFFFWIEALELFFVLILTPYRLSLDGFQRIDIRKYLDIVLYIIKFPLVYFCFKFISNTNIAFISYVFLNTLFFVSSSLIVYGLFFKKNFPNYQVKLFFYDHSVFSILIHFSVFSFILQISEMVIMQASPVIIANIIGVESVAFFSLGANIASQMRLINSFLGWPIFIYIAGIIGKNELDKEKMLFFKGTKLYSAIFVPIPLIAVVFFYKFINAWVGPSFSPAIRVGQVLMLMWIFAAHLKMFSSFIMARALLKEVSILNVFQALTNIVLSIILIKKYGIIGAALGIVLPYVVFGIIGFLLVYPKLKMGSELDFILNGIGKNVLFYLFCFFISKTIECYLPTVNIYMLILCMGIIYAFMMMLYYLFFMDREDKGMVKRILKGIRT